MMMDDDDGTIMSRHVQKVLQVVTFSVFGKLTAKHANSDVDGMYTVRHNCWTP